MSVQGLANGCASMSDNTTLETFLKSQSVIMNISESNIHYKSCTAMRRLFTKELNSFFNLQSSYNLATQAIITLKQVDTNNNNNTAVTNVAAIVFQKISSVLSTAVTSGSFAQVMKATAKSLGVIGNTSIFHVSEASSSGLQVTVFTYSPTKSPSQKPSQIPSQQQFTPFITIPTTTNPTLIKISITLNPTVQTVQQLTVEAIIGIAIGGSLLLLCLAIALIYHFCSRRNPIKITKVFVEKTPKIEK